MSCIALGMISVCLMRVGTDTIDSYKKCDCGGNMLLDIMRGVYAGTFHSVPSRSEVAKITLVLTLSEDEHECFFVYSHHEGVNTISGSRQEVIDYLVEMGRVQVLTGDVDMAKGVYFLLQEVKTKMSLFYGVEVI